MKYQDSKSKSQMIDEGSLILSIIYKTLILSLIKTFSPMNKGLLTSDSDEYDHQFQPGERTAEGFFKLKTKKV
jgi:hypothetical protein